MLADQGRHQLRIRRRALETSLRDARNRAAGAWHKTAVRFAADGACDEMLEARIRSALGRHCSHPGAIQVSCEGQRVILRGDVLAREVEEVVRCVRQVRGVHDVVNEMAMHPNPDIPALQGQGHVRTSLPGEWTPAVGLAAALAGVGLALYGATRHSPAGGMLSAIGAGLSMKGLHEMEGSHKPGPRAGANHRPHLSVPLHP